MEFDNPASRLLALLNAGGKFEREASCRAVWSSILEIGGGNDELMYRLGAAMQLPQQVYRAISIDFPSQRRPVDHVVATLFNAFGQQNLAGKWDSFINHIDIHTLNYIGVIAELLQTKANTNVIDKPKLDEIRKILFDLLDEVEKSDELSEDTKRYFVFSIKCMIDAVNEYNISGVSPITDAIESTVGHIVMNDGVKSEVTKSEIGKRIMGVIKEVSVIIATIVNIPRLVEIFTNLLR